MDQKSKSSQDARLASIYYDPSNRGGYAGVQPLYREVKRRKYPISLKEVKKWLKSQDTYTLHKSIKRKFPRNKTRVTDMDEQWQLDLADVSNLKTHNEGYTFLLCVIDVLSKYAWVVPLKNKSAKEMVRGFQEVLKQGQGRRPIRVQTDKGKEFLNREFRQTFHDIHFFTTDNTETKASIVERFQRTLKARMWRYFTHTRSRRYVDVLPQIVQAYNHSYHRSIRRSPIEVNPSNVLEVWETLYGTRSKRRPSPKFHAGDRVRISKAKRTFDKGYLPNWTSELFTVEKRVPDRYPYVYYVQDDHQERLEGTFYESELQAVVKMDDVYEVDDILDHRKRRVGKRRVIEEVKVHWKGYPSSFDSWIPKSNLI